MASRLAAFFRRTWADPSIRLGLTAFVVLRIVLAVWMWGVRRVITLPLPPDPVARPYLGVSVETHPWLEPWQRWDTLHYQAIAERGYTSFDSALFTPPLYPVLMRAVSETLGCSTLVAAILISNAAAVLLFISFHRLAAMETGGDPAAGRAVIYLASFPTAFFLLAGYTESLFLLAAVMTLGCARRGQWLASGLWAAAAALVRLPGLLVLLPLGYLAWSSHGGPRGRGWIGLGIGVAGALAFPAYVWLILGQPPWQPFVAQTQRFAGGFSFPGVNALEAAQRILQGDAYLADILDLVAILGFTLLAIPVWRRLHQAYGLYYLGFLGLYLTRLGGFQPLLGSTRYVLSLFPAFLVLGQAGRSPAWHRLILYASWAGQLLLSGQFAIWGWVG